MKYTIPDYLTAIELPDGTWLVTDTRSDAYCTLSPSTGVIWELFREASDMGQVVGRASERFNGAPAARVHAAVEEAVHLLEDQGLLVPDRRRDEP